MVFIYETIHQIFSLSFTFGTDTAIRTSADAHERVLTHGLEKCKMLQIFRKQNMTMHLDHHRCFAGFHFPAYLH